MALSKWEPYASGGYRIRIGQHDLRVYCDDGEWFASYHGFFAIHPLTRKSDTDAQQEALSLLHAKVIELSMDVNDVIGET